MKKTILIAVVLSILAFYTGMAINQEHPMDELHSTVIDKINDSHVINFKSGYLIEVYNSRDVIIDQWQYKQQGIFDAYSKYLNTQNVKQFDFELMNKDEINNKTSLSFEEKGELLFLPISEVYYKNNDLFYLDRLTNTWSYQQKNSYAILELLVFNSELLNRYSTYYKSDNRGEFVVFYYSIDPEYLTKEYPNILEANNLSFPYKFTEATIKLLVYPDTTLPRRVYSIFHLENLDTHDLYSIKIDTYFSENEEFDNTEPEIPANIQKIK